MDLAAQKSAGKERTQKGFASKFASFLMYGGFLLVIAVGLVIVVLLDVYIF